MPNESDAVAVEILLPISEVLKAKEKQNLLAELSGHLSGIEPIKITSTRYREIYGADVSAPLLLVATIITTTAAAIEIVRALNDMKKWLYKQGKTSDTPGIHVKVDKEGYSIKNCKTADDIIKIIREVKRRQQ